MFAGSSPGGKEKPGRDDGIYRLGKTFYAEGIMFPRLKVCFYDGWRVADAGNKTEDLSSIQRHLDRRGTRAMEDKRVRSGRTWNKLSTESLLIDAL